LLLSCFDEFWWIGCESWIGDYLFLKHVWIHFINVCLCFYVDEIWIDVVVYEVWIKNEKMVVVGENELDDEFEVNWCYDSTFLLFWMPFYVHKLGCKFWDRIWGEGDQKWGFWIKSVCSREGTAKTGQLFWCFFAVASYTGTTPYVLGVSGFEGSIRSVQTDSFDVINCIWIF